MGYDMSNFRVYSNRNQVVESKKLFLFRRFLKRACKNNSDKSVKKLFIKVYYNLNLNKKLTKKVKNSRMGKGKGKPLRRVTFFKKNFIIFIFIGLNPIISLKCSSFLNKRKVFVNYQFNENNFKTSNLKKNVYFYNFYKIS
jgi:hypothetical protein